MSVKVVKYVTGRFFMYAIGPVNCGMAPRNIVFVRFVCVACVVRVV